MEGLPEFLKDPNEEVNGRHEPWPLDPLPGSQKRRMLYNLTAIFNDQIAERSCILSLGTA